VVVFQGSITTRSFVLGKPEAGLGRRWRHPEFHRLKLVGSLQSSEVHGLAKTHRQRHIVTDFQKLNILKFDKFYILDE
jgi:hypothetical protein